MSDTPTLVDVQFFADRVRADRARLDTSDPPDITARPAPLGAERGAVDAGAPTIVASTTPQTSVPAEEARGTEIFEDQVAYRSIPTDLKLRPPVAQSAPQGADVSDNPLPDDMSFRYEDLGLIGRGTMGEVRRVRDRDLNRVVAMKVVRGSLTGNRRLLARFISEAQAAAQLAHPSIVPIHELGVLPDRRFFFTMKEIKGETLRQVIHALHGSKNDGGHTLRSVVGLFKKACEAVAYAHDRSVLHRDLKPDNIMIGAFGEVLVLDWGLAKVLEAVEDAPQDPEADEPVVTNRSIDAGLKTQVGTVAGTPCYMPPEQAAGHFGELRPSADVYALGAILYEIVVGRPPYSTGDAREILRRAMDPQGGAPLSGRSRIPGIPAGLAEVAERALRPFPEDRYPSAGDMVAALTVWTDGEVRRVRASELVAEARAQFVQADEVREGRRAHRAQRRRAQQRVLVGGDPTALYAAEERVDGATRHIHALEEEAVSLLRGALSEAPDLTDAHVALAEHYRRRHARAARRHDPSARQWLRLLSVHDRGDHSGYLQGEGYLSLDSSPRGAKVFVSKESTEGRREVPGIERPLGVTPLSAVALPAGTWRVRLELPRRPPLVVPVRIDRLGYWDGVAPGEDRPEAIAVPNALGLADGDITVSAGWFRAGADALTGAGVEDVWLDSYVVRRDPVTLAEFAAFLSALVVDGEEEAAERLVIAISGGAVGQLVRDAEGWSPGAGLDDVPVTGVTHDAAVAYAAWWSRVIGADWRLPTELEWEKAARGVDGRRYPWGDQGLWAAAATAETVSAPAEVSAWPLDESPYGVRGCAGNVAEWCADAYQASGPLVAPDGRAVRPIDPGPNAPRAVRGGSFRSPLVEATVARRRMTQPHVSDPTVGFRLVRNA